MLILRTRPSSKQHNNQQELGKARKQGVRDKPSVFDCMKRLVTSPRDKESDKDNRDAESNRSVDEKVKQL